MGAVNPNRLRWGACAWLLTLQFFVVETVVQLRMDGYSRTDDVISLLGDPRMRDAEVLRMPAGSNPSWLSRAQFDAVLDRAPDVRLGPWDG